MQASWFGNVEVVRLLLRDIIDANKDVGTDLDDAVLVAWQSRLYLEKYKIVLMLFKAGAFMGRRFIELLEFNTQSGRDNIAGMAEID